ncbi:hypothetical protein [Paludisphaera soli]|uniref:hypothetical protein n=1 Tax=Paludisphaera soli TaxID=2712865 RepID=UPI0013EB381D|nr:hypothetical protein [Paludisphaera soli]
MLSSELESIEGMESDEEVRRVCSNCGTAGPWSEDAEAADDAWNDLPRDPEPKEAAATS